MQTKWLAAVTADPPTPSQPRLLAMVSRAGRQWRRAVDLHLQPFDLTEAAWLPLLTIARAAEPMRQKDVAAALMLDKSSVVRLLRGLEDAGLIVSAADSDDLRAKAIHVTSRGRALAGRVDAAARELERELLTEIPPEEQEVARRVLARLTDLLERRLKDRENRS